MLCVKKTTENVAVRALGSAQGASERDAAEFRHREAGPGDMSSIKQILGFPQLPPALHGPKFGSSSAGKEPAVRCSSRHVLSVASSVEMPLILCQTMARDVWLRWAK